MPQRIQRKRTKGWKMPDNTVYVGRPSVWQNRWRIGDFSRHLGKVIENRQEAVKCFKDVGPLTEPNGFAEYAKERLRGKDLACWCPLDQPCHADVLLEIANNL